MQYPTAFYYLLSQLGTVYKDYPTDQLDVNRLIALQSYWIDPAPQSIIKCKKLVICDWTLQTRSEPEKNQLIIQLSSLLEEGFELYVWQAGIIRRLGKDNLNDVICSKGALQQITVAEPRDIVTAAIKQQRMTHDDVLLIDDYWVDTILADYNENSRVIKITDLLSLDERHQEILIASLKKAKPVLSTLIVDEFSSKATALSTRLKREFTHLSTVVHYKNIVYDSQTTDETINNNIRRGLFDRVETLVFDNQSPFETLVFNQLALFQHAPIKIHKLDLSGFRGAISFDHLELPYLKEITLDGTSLSNQQLQALFEAAPNLEKVSLKNCSNIHIGMDVAMSIPISVCHLDLTNVSAESECSHLKLFINNCLNIKTLNIKAHSYTLSSIDDKYYQLETLRCDELVPGLLIDILKNNTSLNLLELSLKDFRLYNYFDFPKNNFPSLFNLALNDVDEGHARILLNLLDSFPNLSTFKLHISSGFKQLSHLHFTNKICNLTSLILESSKGRFAEASDFRDFFQAFLTQAPHLNQLELSHFIVFNSSTTESLQSINQNNIEKLVLHKSTFPVDFFQKLLTSSPKIKVLELHEITLEGELYFLPNSLLNIEESVITSKTKYGRTIGLTEQQINVLRAAAGHEEKTEEKIIIPIEKKPTNTHTLSPKIPQSRNSPYLVDPVHDYKQYQQFTPQDEHEPFEFSGTNKTLNQSMIIEKLSQYLLLNGKPQAEIAKMRHGICIGLSHFYIDNSNSWDMLMRTISEWDGQQDNITTPLSDCFDSLFSYVDKYQLHPKNTPIAFVGDNLDSLLNHKTTPFVLYNTWHAITVSKNQDNTWSVYDPNYVNGPKKDIQRGDLLAIIKRSLGKYVGIDAQDNVVEAKLNKPDLFLKKGGLLALSFFSNKAEILQEMLPMPLFSEQSLDGILLRNTKGVPAWVTGIASSDSILKAVSYAIMQQFIAKHPQDYQRLLQRSIESLSPEQKQRYLAEVMDYFSKAKPLEDRLDENNKALNDMLYNTLDAGYYEDKFATWRIKNSMISTLDNYLQRVFNERKEQIEEIEPASSSVVPADLRITRRLITFENSTDLEGMSWAIQRYAKECLRPVFYIHSPDDLVCASPYVVNRDGHGILKKAPGGRLHDFLVAEYDEANPPLLIVNYEKFTDEDIVRFNKLVEDGPRYADGTRIPDHLQLIGLINAAKPDVYQGADFYSRFEIKEKNPIASHVLHPEIPVLPVTVAQDSIESETPAIELFNGFDWKQRLIDHWEMQEGSLHLVEGALRQALRNNPRQLVIQNGLWQQQEFQLFWKKAVHQGFIDSPGGPIDFPPQCKILVKEGYDWEKLAQNMAVTNGAYLTEGVVLNPTRLGSYFGQYAVESNVLIKTPGLLLQASSEASHKLVVNLSRALSEDQWAMLLTECQRIDVKLMVQLAPGVTVPPVLACNVIPKSPEDAPPFDKQALSETEIIVSTDTDTTVAQLSGEGDDTIIIDVSELKASDLFLKLEPQLKEERDTLHFDFRQKIGALEQALAQAKCVILKGRFSQELADECTDYLLKRRLSSLPDSKQLLLICEQDKDFQGVVTKRHLVTRDEKKQLLPHHELLCPKWLDSEPLSKLTARLNYLTRNPNKNDSEEAWLGMQYLPSAMNWLDDFKIDDTAIDAEAFMAKRIDAVEQVLLNEPYVFIAGLSGVGKSTFVEEVFSEEGNKPYIGENQLTAWAEDHSDKRKILFIDEANLSARQWSEFEGLFHHPQTIVINGVLHHLSPKHKVIFAGNPCSYGDERQLAPLFKRHGNAIVFTPLPAAFLYEKVLKPVFENTSLQPVAAALSKPLLQVYQFLCNLSTEEVLISPRELQTMALWLLSHLKHSPNTKDLVAVATDIAHDIGRTLVPDIYQHAFEDKFPKRGTLPLEMVPQDERDPPHFVVTTSRQSIKDKIQGFLTLRELRKQPGINDSKAYGGLGGLLLEGEPGVGKSKLVMSMLIANGYEEQSISDLEAPARGPNPFYVLPVSLSPAQKKKVLLKAFHEGAVVVIDEINSSPMMERLLNNLLMGKTADGKRPEHPGFLVICTQNPVSMAGRRVASTALNRRLLTEIVPKYATDEMKDILKAKKIPENKIEALVSAYEKQLNHAKNRHLTPEPTFRDLLRVASEHRPEPEKIDQTTQAQADLVADKNVLAFAQEPGQDILTQGLKDKFLLPAIMKSQKQIHGLSAPIVNDLLLLKTFHDKKKKKDSNSQWITYNQALDNFYKEVLLIRLSDKTNKQQADEMVRIAHTEFKHRQGGLRLLCDALIVIGTLFAGVGLLIGLIRKARGNTFFFSQEKTEREKSFDEFLAKTMLCSAS